MKRLLMILPLLLFVGEAAAVDRHNMSKMTCEEVHTALQTGDKDILMSPSSKVPGMMRHEMYVGDRRACGSPPNWAQPTKIKVADGKSCTVYRCISITRSTPRY
jgi:hypothetical protein